MFVRYFSRAVCRPPPLDVLLGSDRPGPGRPMFLVGRRWLPRNSRPGPGKGALPLGNRWDFWIAPGKLAIGGKLRREMQPCFLIENVNTTRRVAVWEDLARYPRSGRARVAVVCGGALRARGPTSRRRAQKTVLFARPFSQVSGNFRITGNNLDLRKHTGHPTPKEPSTIRGGRPSDSR